MTALPTLWSRLLVRRSVVPGARPPVEPQSAGEGASPDRPLPANRYPNPLLTKPDQWAEVMHGGSADLEEFPPSITESHFASRVFHGELAARRSLVSVCQSVERASAVLRLVRREALAAGVLSRATGGET